MFSEGQATRWHERTFSDCERRIELAIAVVFRHAVPVAVPVAGDIARVRRTGAGASEHCTLAPRGKGVAVVAAQPVLPLTTLERWMICTPHSAVKYEALPYRWPSVLWRRRPSLGSRNSDTSCATRYNAL